MYELFYGLNRRPFRMSPNLDCFYLSQSHKRALAHLRYGLLEAEGFVVLTGLAGSGKTVLLGLLVNELKKQDVQVARVGNAVLDDSDLLPAILASFNKPIFEYKLRALVSQLETFLLSEAKSGQRSVIVIDDAQNLSQRSLEILRLLSNLQYENQQVLQVVLVGDVSLDETISDPENHSLRQRIVMSYQINPMQEKDTKNYILHRLACAGWSADSELKFEDEVFEIVHQLSGGLPGEINRFFDRLLMQGMLQQKHSLSGKDIENLLSDDHNFGQPAAIEYQPTEEAKSAEVIEAVAEVSVDVSLQSDEKDKAEVKPEPESAVKQEQVKVENVYLNALEKELEDNDEFSTDDFNAKEDQKEPGAVATLLLSYAASLVLAIGLFYVADIIPEDDMVIKIDQSQPTQLVQREGTSLAVID